MTAKVFDVGQNYAGFTQHTSHGGFPINLSATGQVIAVPGQLLGFYVNSTTAGTIIIYDALTATAPISGTITPALGWNAFPSIHLIGIFVTLATINVTFFYLK